MKPSINGIIKPLLKKPLKDEKFIGKVEEEKEKKRKKCASVRLKLQTPKIKKKNLRNREQKLGKPRKKTEKSKGS